MDTAMKTWELQARARRTAARVRAGAGLGGRDSEQATALAAWNANSTTLAPTAAGAGRECVACSD